MDYVLIVIVGLLAGGLVNILADDLPHYHRPRLPHYSDDTPRPPIAWLGVTAFLSGKRASPGGAKLSWRHPLAELITVLAMLLTYGLKHDSPDVSGLQMVFWLIYMAIFVLITVIDIEHRLILFSVVIPAAGLAILDAALTPINHEPNLQRSLLGGGLGLVTFILLYFGGFVYTYVAQHVMGRNITEVAFGFGDVMLATFSGLVLGLEAMIFAMFITVFLGAFGALVYIVVSRVAGRGYALFTALPYGPYIVAGTAIMLLFNQQVRFFLAGY
jgi:prepilin signal peptidase PulO-like enzyme (type II secretory pathway)